MSNRSVSYNHNFSEKWIRDLSPTEWRGKVDVEFLDVPLSALEHAGCWTDPDVVAGWVRTLSHGASIPPPVAVRTERGTYYLHDGNHRLEALQQFHADDGDAAMVRIARALPLPGHRFVYRSLGSYGTYVMEDCPRRFETAARAAAAITASGVALGLTSLLPGVDETPFFVFFVISVMIAAWAGGWKAGLLATMFNMIGAAYFLLPPTPSIFIDNTGHLIQFVVTGLAMMAVALFMAYVRRHPRVELGLPPGREPEKKLADSVRSAG